MLKNAGLLDAFNRALGERSQPDYPRNLEIVEGLLEEALLLGVWPPKDSWRGIETKIRIARIANHVQNASRKTGDRS